MLSKTKRIKFVNLILVLLLLIMPVSTVHAQTEQEAGASDSQSSDALIPMAYACPPTSCTPGKDADETFMQGVLNQLGISPSNFAVQMLMSWKPYENTLACWNPLATTRKMEYICNFNGVGVQHYQTKEMGIGGTAQTLALNYYTAIRAMLSGQNFDREAIRSSLSTWGTCSGTSCNTLLNTWQSQFSSQTPPEPAGPGEVILETPGLNPAAGPVCSTGWLQLTNNRGHPFYLTLNTNVQSSSTNSATWTPNLPFAGKWRVEAYVANHGIIDWPCAHKPRILWDTSDARYTVHHAGGDSTSSGNQAPLTDQWLHIGDFQFNAGTGGNVRLTDLNGEANTSKTIQFGAMKFTVLTPHGNASGLVASDGSYTDRVTLNWSGVTNASSYQVFRADSSGGNRAHVATPTTTTWADTNVVQSKTYWYWVKACNNQGCTDYSNGDSGFALLPIPSSPSTLTASDGTYTDKVALNWTAVNGAANYQIFKANSETGTKQLFATVTNPSYADTTITQGVSYWYWVKACNATGCSDYSAGDSGFAKSPIPRPPTNVQATDGLFENKIDISWNVIDGADNYQLFRSGAETGSKVLTATISTNEYSDGSVTSGMTYWYWVKACNDSGCSDFSLGDTGFAKIPIPPVPNNVEATDGDYPDKVVVSWTPNPQVTSFNIYRSDTETGLKMKIGESSTNVYSDNNVVSGVTYWYWVNACNDGGCSDFSDGDSGFALLPVPQAPMNVSATDGLYIDKVQVNWDAVTGAASYQVYRGTTETGSKQLLASIHNPSYSDITAIQGQTYWYWIKSCNVSGCSGFSIGDSGFAQLPPPNTPSNLQATDGTFSNRVEITWNLIGGADNYQVYRSETENGIKSLITTVSAPNYSDLSVVSGNIYWYWVKACNASGCSNFSDGDSGFASILIPQPPMSLTASDGTYTDKVLLNWSNSVGSTHYFIYRSNTETGVKTNIGESETNVYFDLNISPGSTFWYWVQACNSGGCSDFSNGDSGYAVVEPPDIPLDVQATDGSFSDKIQITWQESNLSNSYSIFRANSENGTKALIGNSTNTMFDDSNLVVNVTYWYWVKACQNSICSDFSSSDSGFATEQIPEAPMNVEASDGEYIDAILVTWETSSNATSYNVYRAMSESGSKSFIATSKDNQYRDTTVPNESEYWYWVKACNTSGCSEFSVSDNGYTKEPLPGIPQSVSASDGLFPDKVIISWNKVDRASEYQLYQSYSPNGIKQFLDSTEQASFTDTDIQVGVLMWYWVKACNQSGCSEYSQSDSGYRLNDQIMLFLPVIWR